MIGALKLLVVSPLGTLVETEADYVSLCLSDGSMGVLRGHAPALARLGAGEILYRLNSEEKRVEIKGGAAEIKDNVITVLADV